MKNFYTGHIDIKALMKYLFIVLFSITLFRVEAATSVKARLDSAKLLMGNVTGLEVEVELDDSYSKVRFPLLEKAESQRFVSLNNDSIEILSRYQIDTLNVSGKSLLKYNLTVQAFDSGKYVIPGFELLIDGAPFYSNKLNLEVIPVKAKADDKLDDFSDVVEPFEVGFSDEDLTESNLFLDLWWLWLLLLVFLCAMAYGIVRWKKTGSIFPPARPLTPFEEAMRQLEVLKEKKLWENGREKEYYSRLVDVLRKYLMNQFGINAMEMTTRQILKGIRKNELLSSMADLIKPALDISDFVKFAKVKPLADDNVDVFNRVRKFIESANKEFEISIAEKGEEK